MQEQLKMGKTMFGLLPLIIAAAVLPTGIIMTLFWLRETRGLIRAAAYASGRLFVQLLQGVLIGYALKEADNAAGPWGTDHIPSGLLVIVGVLFLSAALFTSLRKPHPAAPDARQARWATVLSRVSAPTAFGIGASMVGFSMRQWFVTTGAVAAINKAQLPLPHVVLAYLYFAVAAQSLILAPVIIKAVAPARTARLLTAAHRWMDRNKRGVTIAVTLVFGVWLIGLGVT
jgi:hypothetical protein